MELIKRDEIPNSSLHDFFGLDKILAPQHSTENLQITTEQQ